MAAAGRGATEAVIRDDLEGMIYGEFGTLRRAMHEKCIVAGHYPGNDDFMPREAFIEQLKGEKPEPAGTPIASSILAIDITGDTAIAKITDDCFGTTFTTISPSSRTRGNGRSWPRPSSATAARAEG
jgi:hypothetical protein